jgi:hypothetical protein
VDDQVGTQLQRPLQDGGAEAVVHRQQRGAIVGDLGQRRDVIDLGERIRRCLDEHQLRVRLHGGTEALRPGAGDEGGIDAEAREDVAEQLLGRAEQAARGDDVVARLEQRHHGRQDGRHAAGRGDAAFRAFQGGQAVLHHRHGRVGEARIDHALLGAGKARGGLGGIGEDEAGGQVERLGMLAELAALLPRAHGQRVEAVLLSHWRAPD